MNDQGMDTIITLESNEQVNPIVVSLIYNRLLCGAFELLF